MLVKTFGDNEKNIRENIVKLKLEHLGYAQKLETEM